MNKYFPSKRELDFLLIGVLIGTIFTIYFKFWGSLAVVAPVIILAWLIRYTFDKREEDFQKQLAKAKDAKALTGKEVS